MKKGKIIIFAIVKQSAMSEEEKKTDDEGKTIPNPEGYTIVKYLEFVVVLCFIIGTLLSIPLFNLFKDDKLLSYGVLLVGGLLFGLLVTNSQK